MRGLKKNVLRETFERAKVAGDPIDGSEVPIYLLDIMAINEAYCKEGSEASAGARRAAPSLCISTGSPTQPRPAPAPCAEAKFSVGSGWHASGRTAEPAWVVEPGLEWDKHFTCLFAQMPHPKVILCIKMHACA